MSELFLGLFSYLYTMYTVYLIRTNVLLHVLQMQVRDIKIEHAIIAAVLKMIK